MKFFSTAGPIKTNKHYHIDPLVRININSIRDLIDQEKYFVLHAPRQTGKTSSLLALRDHLNTEGKFYAVYVNVEDAQTSRNDVEQGIATIIEIFRSKISFIHKDILPEFMSVYNSIKDIPGHHRLHAMISSLSQKLDKPLMIMIDEIDSLVGDTLISVLRQLRSGYEQRPSGFAQSIILCGVRDVRDYRIHSKEYDEIITGGSAFNIKSKSLRVGDFTFDEVKELISQHTIETGQKFDDDVFPFVWDLTAGQPWLVNALAYETCFELEKDRSKSITKELIEQAKENMIIRRDTHIDILIDKLSEERVRRVIEPILFNDADTEKQFKTDDISYVVDMGLIRKEKNLIISNDIYREIIPRELTYTTQYTIVEEVLWYVENNKLNMTKLLNRFQEFFRDNSEMWLERFQYKEAGPHLLLMAFLQRVINGEGKIHREYGLGTKRIDLLIEFQNQRIAIETKVLRGDKTRKEGLNQLSMYMDKSGADEGHLIIFNKNSDINWDDKLTYEKIDDKISIWGM